MQIDLPTFKKQTASSPTVPSAMLQRSVLTWNH